ncbi:MAG: SRPBCC domain-containing protein [Rhodocyclaceae bacterium]|nr:SRPBCC domain-containing protein [Rhodocyclaceae bacterium]
MDDRADHDMLALELHRVFSHSRERVFDAWRRPDALMAWMGPSAAVNATEVDMDFREGGAYRIAFDDGSGRLRRVRGRYLTIDRPKRLAFTWIWSEASPADEVETTVVLDFVEHPRGTQLHLRHLRFASAEERQRHEAGWSGTLDKLAGHLAHERG